MPAAGFGERMGSSIPKQYISIGGHSILQHTLTNLLAVPDVEGIVVTLSATDALWPSVAAGSDERVHITEGGETRTESVISGLRYVLNIAPESTWVLVHDAARPLVHISDIKRLNDAVYNSGAIGGILATPVQDTLKKADEYCCIEQTVSRQQLWQAQTPQLFRAGQLLGALQAAQQGAEGSATLTDEASAMENAGHEPLLVEALHPNLKITRPADLQLAEALILNAGNYS